MSISESRAGPTVVIGLGNPLMGDDGVGIAALERLRETRDIPAGVELIDGGTWGLNLLPVIETAARVLLIDAITTGAGPGTATLIPHARLPRYLATRISPHEVDLRDVLALAELRGTLPEETIAVGLEPVRVELGTELSPVLRARLDELVSLVVDQLAAWGYACAPRAATISA